eukprot:287259-Prorocentrum_minimum.AAC.1
MKYEGRYARGAGNGDQSRERERNIRTRSGAWGPIARERKEHTMLTKMSTGFLSCERFTSRGCSGFFTCAKKPGQEGVRR